MSCSTGISELSVERNEAIACIFARGVIWLHAGRVQVSQNHPDSSQIGPELCPRPALMAPKSSRPMSATMTVTQLIQLNRLLQNAC